MIVVVIMVMTVVMVVVILVALLEAPLGHRSFPGVVLYVPAI